MEILTKLKDSREKLFQELSKVIVGQDKIIEHMFIALLCKGHVLLEGVPGLAKTLLIKCLSNGLDLKFNRIQFTPDLMPSDITGTELINQNKETGDRTFSFHKGPLFSNIVLADEINRTPPKTQSALLQAMQEKKITAGGKTYDLDRPFFVLATQNPIEQEGTYPLPEAQLDRFMFNLIIDYPSRDEELSIVKNQNQQDPETIKPVISANELIEYQKLVENVPVADNVIEYAVDFIKKTRVKDKKNKWLDWGAGPRASTHLILAAKAKALMSEKTTPDISDVKDILKPVLRHRIVPNFNAEAEGKTKDTIIDELLVS
ncbi:MAG: AAA family ATPase [Candidatus Marinimicrobia bacterium]|nr:AAA family ATPase [Candidatus Neomarinimicrobiota bacterium]|tara:strand:- start:5689 stop:6639 length:951 start_codon:yes stop_codon:yes gene_type:complete